MKSCSLIQWTIWLCASSVVALSAPKLNDTPEYLATMTKKFADTNDFSAVAQLVETQERNWNASPSLSYFGNMLQIGSALAFSTKQTDQRYWMFRKVVWKVLLKPYPPAQDSTDIGRVSDVKEQLLFDAVNLVPYVGEAKPNMYVAIRHDEAMMLMEYARQIHSNLIPNYHDKPVGLMNDRESQRRLFQNEIDNAMQEQMRLSSGLLSSRFYMYTLMYAYQRSPRNDRELLEVLDALDIGGADRDMVLRGVIGKTGRSMGENGLDLPGNK